MPPHDLRSFEGLSGRVSAEVARTGTGLELTYRVSDPSSLRLPAPAASRRTDGLWRHTCFEAFVTAGDAPYLEFNFSPATAWAAYRFSAYRTGMEPLDIPAPAVSVCRSGEALTLTAQVELSGVEGLSSKAPWQLGMCTVLEDASGAISYWALAHPPGKPDFHHPDSFVLDLPLTDS